MIAYDSRKEGKGEGKVGVEEKEELKWVAE